MRRRQCFAISPSMATFPACSYRLKACRERASRRAKAPTSTLSTLHPGNCGTLKRAIEVQRLLADGYDRARRRESLQLMGVAQKPRSGPQTAICFGATGVLAALEPPASWAARRLCPAFEMRCRQCVSSASYRRCQVFDELAHSGFELNRHPAHRAAHDADRLTGSTGQPV